MPVHKIKGGYQWGNHGKVYHGKDAKAKAEAQGRAAYAHGYKGHSKTAKEMHSPKSKMGKMMKEHMK